MVSNHASYVIPGISTIFGEKKFLKRPENLQPMFFDIKDGYD
jgi:hypothetical protein